MKAILISIKPKWVAKILNGEKTIEIRKTMPKCDLPIDVYIYCTKEDSLSILKTYPKDTYVCEQEFKCDDFPYLCSGYEGKGKVVAKFTLNRIDRHHVLPTERILPFNWNVEEKLNQLCLTKEEVMAYGNGEDYYAYLWHISNLEIFDKPKELSEFNKLGVPTYEQAKPFVEKYRRFDKKRYYEDCKVCGFAITKAPQSWCYVEIG